ncbi:TIR domain-containing protein [Castellaniella sp. MT123]|uniref:TIR domain-containing protein n=1 Tax=Castellaniella sp. MT123 TaxID=3140381 RepID=UPI0031F46058
MGGGSGGGLFSSDIRSLEDKVKQRLAEAKGDVSRHVFISFDHEDLDEVNLLRGQAKNDKMDLQFDDHSVKEPYDSTNADYIKRNICEKIDRCSVTLVYLTDKTASSKWINWEIEESLKRGKGRVSGILWARHNMRENDHGYARETQETIHRGAGGRPRGAAAQAA